MNHSCYQMHFLHLCFYFLILWNTFPHLCILKYSILPTISSVSVLSLWLSCSFSLSLPLFLFLSLSHSLFLFCLSITLCFSTISSYPVFFCYFSSNSLLIRYAYSFLYLYLFIFSLFQLITYFSFVSLSLNILLIFSKPSFPSN